MNNESSRRAPSRRVSTIKFNERNWERDIFIHPQALPNDYGQTAETPWGLRRTSFRRRARNERSRRRSLNQTPRGPPQWWLGAAHRRRLFSPVPRRHCEPTAGAQAHPLAAPGRAAEVLRAMARSHAAAGPCATPCFFRRLRRPDFMPAPARRSSHAQPPPPPPSGGRGARRCRGPGVHWGASESPLYTPAPHSLADRAGTNRPGGSAARREGAPHGPGRAAASGWAEGHGIARRQACGRWAQ